MSRAGQTFRQGDVTKAVKGVVNGGLKVERVEIDSAGKIVVFADKSTLAATRNEWDEVR
jgi:hypothetical protein